MCRKVVTFADVTAAENKILLNSHWPASKQNKLDSQSKQSCKQTKNFLAGKVGNEETKIGRYVVFPFVAHSEIQIGFGAFGAICQIHDCCEGNTIQQKCGEKQSLSVALPPPHDRLC